MSSKNKPAESGAQGTEQGNPAQEVTTANSTTQVVEKVDAEKAKLEAQLAEAEAAKEALEAQLAKAKAANPSTDGAPAVAVVLAESSPTVKVQFAKAHELQNGSERVAYAKGERASLEPHVASILANRQIVVILSK